MNFNDRVSIELGDNGVAQVRFTRGDKMNALDPDQFEAVLAAGDALRDMQGLRVAVLSGEGRAFCAGLDTASFGGDPTGSGTLAERSHGNANRAQEAAMTWRKCPVPVIAAVHGVCFGGGLQIASGADIRVVHPATRMAVMEMKWGLVPDMGGYALWRGLVRDDILRELTYTNRIFNGPEAQEMGFATHVSDNPLDDAMALAKQIALKNPDAIKASKRIFNSMQDATDAELLMAESVEQDKIIRTPNQMEGGFAEMQKRKPAFTD